MSEDTLLSKLTDQAIEHKLANGMTSYAIASEYLTPVLADTGLNLFDQLAVLDTVYALLAIVDKKSFVAGMQLERKILDW